MKAFFVNYVIYRKDKTDFTTDDFSGGCILPVESDIHNCIKKAGLDSVGSSFFIDIPKPPSMKEGESSGFEIRTEHNHDLQWLVEHGHWQKYR